MNEKYQVDTAKIMHETIDGEVIIVNLENGLYYSTDGVGTHLWTDIASGDASLDTLVSGAQAAFTGEAQAIAAGVSGFVQQLKDEDLIVAVPGNGAASAPATTAAAGAAFAEPVLQKFQDMEALLLVDPIHEVVDDGWPNVE